MSQFEIQKKNLTLALLERSCYILNVKKPKKPRDINQLAALIVAEATSENPTDPIKENPDSTKNPAAVELGRLGGLKGGKARASKLSPERRSEIASIAASKRWHNQEDNKTD